MKYIYLLLIIFSGTLLIGCGNNPAESPNQQEYNFIFQKQGLLDSIVGTCSSFLVRTIPLDTLDFTAYSKLRITMESFTDGDLSSVQIYRLVSDTIANIYYAEGLLGVNTQGPVMINSPKDRKMYFVRMKLFSSVCTGQYFHLKVRNLNIYGY
ncbi:MAG: hypothetical protein JW917_11030 [Ignavibacteria bacterium]|nr:hypothetical protein [Ignavibacteria bacterium]